MTTFLKNSLAGREPLKKVMIYAAIFSFVAGLVGQPFNEAQLYIRVPVFVVLGALTLLWCAILWRCADNSDLDIGWIIRGLIAIGVVSVMLLLFL